jgi:hypothetical protein
MWPQAQKNEFWVSPLEQRLLLVLEINGLIYHPLRLTRQRLEPIVRTLVSVSSFLLGQPQAEVVGQSPSADFVCLVRVEPLLVKPANNQRIEPIYIQICLVGFIQLSEQV